MAGRAAGAFQPRPARARAWQLHALHGGCTQLDAPGLCWEPEPRAGRWDAGEGKGADIGASAPPGSLQPRLLGAEAMSPGSSEHPEGGGSGQKRPDLSQLSSSLLSGLEHNAHTGAVKRRQTPSTESPGPSSTPKWAEVAQPMQGPRAMRTAMEGRGRGQRPSSTRAVLSAPPREMLSELPVPRLQSRVEAFCEVLLLGGRRLCLAEHRESQRAWGGRDFPGGLHVTPLLVLPALPFLVPRASRSLCHRDGHVALPIAPRRAGCSPDLCHAGGAEGAGMTPLATARGCR